MTRHIDQYSDNVHDQAVIARLYDIARNGDTDGSELRELDAEIQAGLAAAYGESEPLPEHSMAA
ncbi:hypothetical protein LC55x_2116 [Lysobacter capsici]|jgi:hypothetical protein|uniref:Uncharacterized protein n=1 Tax=Lysobacter capsici AZ78 TaxID=1444315 RepID=A0A108U6I1_9GAMM|nr:hypothetical protein [Lysobacter capsici]ALN85391.1 hypothetical protein LC55x_2116 [Lysobacter capsici]KWS03450.1 hypothetical protein AZ78_0997 [Lysobacter capsici AZ78]WND82553.1 hypothetical protein RJ610_09455 [Lysobacter capsici]WND87749.1 hypothetical protein RJ609_09460 [Lysobacter capsici]